jgi:hypothetical protein
MLWAVLWAVLQAVLLVVKAVGLSQRWGLSALELVGAVGSQRTVSCCYSALVTYYWLVATKGGGYMQGGLVTSDLG